MARKETSPILSALAGRILFQGYQPTRDEIESMAASLAGQDETPGDPYKPEAPEAANDQGDDDDGLPQGS